MPSETNITKFIALLGLLAVAMSTATAAATPDARDVSAVSALRGVFFNPQLQEGRAWLLRYPACRTQVKKMVQELSHETPVNMVVAYVNIAYSMRTPTELPTQDQAFAQWANTTYLDNVANFVDDCFDVGLAVELDLASNLWVPWSVQPEHQIGNSPHWPKPDETPWDEAAAWYSGCINYIEDRAKHPENIALWVMTGNHELGEAEPRLWPDESNPLLLAGIEQTVKYVWPVFRAAGKRPKAPPYMFGIFSNNPYWMAKSPEERLTGFSNLKKWIVDDLGMPPDYWVFTAYPNCDPAPDGFYYLRAIMDILGPENASHIIATDLKGPGHEAEYAHTILSVAGQSGVDLLEWHWQKFAEYGIQNWWIWCYQDTNEKTPWAKSGLRQIDGAWKKDRIQTVNKESQ